MRLTRKVTKSVVLSTGSRTEVRKAFRAITSRTHIPGANRTPIFPRYLPDFRFSLFDSQFYLTRVRKNPLLRFFVAYVVKRTPRGLQAAGRIFYKDLSLVWRSASHYIEDGDEFWIGKGDVRIVREGDLEYLDSIESTTDLPLEMQQVLEDLNRDCGKAVTDHQALRLFLKRGPVGRIAPYQDFYGPRRRAASDSRNLVHGGRSVARFRRKNDPASLTFTAGYEPDFRRGVLEVHRSHSKLYGGPLRRFRILSANRKIQYLFIAGRKHVWIIPPQATTTELSSFGVRTVDVVVDEDLCVPGYEYHDFDPDIDPSEHFSQIPEGYAGKPSPFDPARADASAWLNALPVIQKFKKQVLGRKR